MAQNQNFNQTKQNTNQNQQNEQNTQREPLRINVVKERKFDSLTESLFCSSTDICKMINGLFAGLFPDYVGCSIQCNTNVTGNVNGIPVYPNPDGVLNELPLNSYYVNIIFKDRGNSALRDGEVKTMIPLHQVNGNNNSGGSLKDRYVRFNGIMMSSKNYKISDETKEAIEEFMIIPNGIKLNDKFWNSRTIEYTEGVSVGLYDNKYVSHCRIVGLSLEKLISKIYGSKDENGNSVEYLVTPCVLPHLGFQNGSGISMFQISRMDTKNFKKLISTLCGGSYASSYIGVDGRI